MLVCLRPVPFFSASSKQTHRRVVFSADIFLNTFQFQTNKPNQANNGPQHWRWHQLGGWLEEAQRLFGHQELRGRVCFALDGGDGFWITFLLSSQIHSIPIGRGSLRGFAGCTQVSTRSPLVQSNQQFVNWKVTIKSLKICSSSNTLCPLSAFPVWRSHCKASALVVLLQLLQRPHPRLLPQPRPPPLMTTMMSTCLDRMTKWTRRLTRPDRNVSPRMLPKSPRVSCHVCLGWPWTHFCYRLLSEPALVAKSNVILDVKPWDDETDMKALETAVRSVQMDGLMWGVSKLVPLAYGIHKLQIVCVVEDEKGKVLFCFWFD